MIEATALPSATASAPTSTPLGKAVNTPPALRDHTGASILMQPLSWDQLCHIIDTNSLRNLGRSPTQLAEYRHFRETLTAQGGDFFEQVLTKLEWTQSDINTARASHRDLLTSTEDIALRVNDFPYYIEADIVHLVVWSKLNIPIDETSKSGDMTPAARDRINQWIERCFLTNMAFGIPRQNITWFKNWAALQSIPKLAHIHLMVRGLTATQLERVLGDKQSLVMLQQ